MKDGATMRFARSPMGVAIVVSAAAHAALAVSLGAARLGSIAGGEDSPATLVVTFDPAAPAEAPVGLEVPAPARTPQATTVGRRVATAKLKDRGEVVATGPVQPLEATMPSALPQPGPADPVDAPSQGSMFASAARSESLASTATPSPETVAYLVAPAPAYPAASRDDGEEGLVMLRVRVTREGRPASIEVRVSSGYAALDAAAVAGVRRWTFRPARRGGEPVESSIDVPVRFRLDRG